MAISVKAANQGPSSPGKRKASSSSLNSQGRPVKRRASKACACCRSRKVRCNVVENGVPCTNCKLDGVECILLESRRRRHVSAANLAAPAPTQSAGSTKDLSPAQSNASLSPIAESSNGMDIADIEQQHGYTPQLNGYDCRHTSHLIYQTQGQPASHQVISRQPPSIVSASPQATHLPPRSTSQPYMRTTLPGFIRIARSRMKPEDLEYLSRKGAFSIPPKSLRLELIRSFVQYVYPYSPLLELRSFLESVLDGDGSGGTTSLLLYQAIMFAGSAFVDLHHLQSSGFPNRRLARKALFLKARLLYDFDYESDRLTLIQALLLMTHWYESPEDQKDTWHWMGISLSLAHTMGLHRDSSAGSSICGAQRGLRRRIWWSLYMRDRMVALGMRRPTRLLSSDCDVPMLTLDDFDTVAFPDNIVQKVGVHFLQDRTQLTALATTCIEKAKLCTCITHILDLQYSSLHARESESYPTGARHQRNIEISGILNCDAELEEWWRQVPPEAQYDTWHAFDDCEDNVLFLNRALLRLNYLTSLSALHRPQVLSPKSRRPGQYDITMASQAKVRYAAVETTEIVQQLQSRDLIKCLSTEGVTILVPTVIIHLLDAKSQDENIRFASLSRVSRCMQALSQLRGTYASAEFAIVLLQSAIQKAHVQLPADPDLLAQPLPFPQSNPSGITPPPDAYDSAPPEFHASDDSNSLHGSVTPPASVYGMEIVSPLANHEVLSTKTTFQSPIPPNEHPFVSSRSSSSTTPRPPNNLTSSQSPIGQALPSLNFLDGIVMPYDDNSVMGSSRGSPAATIANWMSSGVDGQLLHHHHFGGVRGVTPAMTPGALGQSGIGSSAGEDGMFALDMDLMVDFATKTVNGSGGLDLDGGIF